MKARKIMALAAALGGLQSCSSKPADTEERAHQLQDAELAKSLGNEGADPLDPFAQAQMLAEDSMGATTGSSLDQTWIRKLIEHQEGTIRMATILLRAKATPEARRIAERVLQDARARVASLKGLRAKSGKADLASSRSLDDKSSPMFAKMSQIEPTSVEQLWARKMVEYNRGAIALAGVEAAGGQDQRVREYARELAAALSNEADNLQRLASTPL